jgi:peptidoglycan pentaglycine glycine transferase (the first glycine)
MEVKEIHNQSELDNFVSSRTGCQFLQSWQWGEFQQAAQRPVMRWGIYDGGQLLGTAQVFEHQLPLGKKYWYIPRGPITDDHLPIEKFETAWRELLAAIVKQADERHAMFVRLEPPIEQASSGLFKSMTKAYRIRPTSFVQPQHTWMLDITQSEEKLLSAMHPKTRYNIKLAERKGVKIRTDETVNDFDAFLSLTTQTAQRDKIKTHSHDYYRTMHRTLVGKGFLQLFSAEYEGKDIAANIVIFFGDMVTYLHGASGDERREFMAPHLLQWRQIQEAKKRGAKLYDFGGVAPASADEKHPWAGITRFKQGFGGYGVSYVGAHDLILDSAWYTIYKLAQKAIIR